MPSVSSSVENSDRDCKAHTKMNEDLLLDFWIHYLGHLVPDIELDVSYTLHFLPRCPTRVEKGERLRELNLTNSNANHTARNETISKKKTERAQSKLQFLQQSPMMCVECFPKCFGDPLQQYLC